MKLMKFLPFKEVPMLCLFSCELSRDQLVIGLQAANIHLKVILNDANHCVSLTSTILVMFDADCLTDGFNIS